MCIFVKCLNMRGGFEQIFIVVELNMSCFVGCCCVYCGYGSFMELVLYNYLVMYLD